VNQFVVPQFIDVEDKILGPITARQFIILLVAGIIIFLTFRFGDFALFIAVLVIVGGIALLFSFAKVNGQAFHYFLLNILQTMRRPPLRVWNKSYSKAELEYLRKFGADLHGKVVAETKVVQRQHIRDLALIVNTGGFYHPNE